MRCWYAFLVLPLAVFAIVVSCVDEPEDSQVGDSELMTATFTGNSLLAETQARVHAEQYRFRPQGKSFAGTNSAQRFSVELAADGVTVSVRKHAILYDWSWATVGFGREGALTEALPAAPADGDCALPPMYGFGDACLAMIEYDRETYIEWYSNRIGGLEQGFEVLEKTEGRGLLVIEGYVSTPLVGRVNDDMSEIVFSDQQGDVLRYSGLAAWDANGVPLDAWMEWIDPDTIRLSVDDTHAAYPITVDPGLSASPDWVAEGIRPKPISVTPYPGPAT
ncbi:MAG: hypothetical protein M5R36_04185 [Deltaproteobacteria bacterium]|nr:hypothetical protein [Deltaproteobacteria bacterium]